MKDTMGAFCAKQQIRKDYRNLFWTQFLKCNLDALNEHVEDPSMARLEHLFCNDSSSSENIPVSLMISNCISHLFTIPFLSGRVCIPSVNLRPKNHQKSAILRSHGSNQEKLDWKRRCLQMCTGNGNGSIQFHGIDQNLAGVIHQSKELLQSKTFWPRWSLEELYGLHRWPSPKTWA